MPHSVQAGDVYRQIARLHRDALRDNWLCHCGVRFLTLFYRTAAGVDAALLLTELDDAGLTAAFLLAATQPNQLLDTVMRRIGWRLFGHPAALALWMARNLRTRRHAAQDGFADSEIFFVAVRPDLRQRGYGRYLVNRAIEALRVRGVSNVALRVSRSNVGALVFYESLGFEFSRPELWKRIMTKKL